MTDTLHFSPMSRFRTSSTTIWSFPSGQCPLISDAEQMEAFVCAKLCLPLRAKLGICEHGVHNCDSGFRRLTSVENQLHWFWVSLWHCVPPELKLWEIRESAQNNQADRSWGRLPGVSSLSVSESLESSILFSFPQFPWHNRHVLACLDTKLYLIRSDLHPDA